MRWFRYAFACCFALGLAGLAAPSTSFADEKKELTNKEKIIGTWEVTKNAAPDAPPGVTIEFTKDGKFKVTAKVNGQEGGYERTYTVDGDKINFGGKGDPKAAKIKKLTETILVVEYGDGATDELKRKKK